MSRRIFKVRLSLRPEPGGGYVVTSPDVPELVTEGDSVAEALANVRDALAAVQELYEDQGRSLPGQFTPDPSGGALDFETVIEAA